MTRIGLISDTHGYLDEAVFEHFKQCDELWHAGDFGNVELANRLAALSGLTLRGCTFCLSRAIGFPLRRSKSNDAAYWWRTSQIQS
jgi:hypothetical protein